MVDLARLLVHHVAPRQAPAPEVRALRSHHAQPQRVARLRGEPLDGAPERHEPGHARLTERAARPAQVVAVRLRHVEYGARCVHRVRDLFQHAAEQRLHVARVQRLEHDAQRAGQPVVRARELLHQPVVLALLRLARVVLVRHQKVRLTRRAHAVAAHGYARLRAGGAHHHERQRASVRREGKCPRVEGVVRDHAGRRWKQRAHVRAHEVLTAEQVLRRLVCHKDAAEAVERQHGVAREREEPRERAGDAPFAYALDPPETKARACHRAPPNRRLRTSTPTDANVLSIPGVAPR